MGDDHQQFDRIRDLVLVAGMQRFYLRFVVTAAGVGQSLLAVTLIKFGEESFH
jgi:hypothetical protein